MISYPQSYKQYFKRLFVTTLFYLGELIGKTNFSYENTDISTMYFNIILIAIFIPILCCIWVLPFPLLIRFIRKKPIEKYLSIFLTFLWTFLSLTILSLFISISSMLILKTNQIGGIGIIPILSMWFFGYKILTDKNIFNQEKVNTVIWNDIIENIEIKGLKPFWRTFAKPIKLTDEKVIISFPNKKLLNSIQSKNVSHIDELLKAINILFPKKPKLIFQSYNVEEPSKISKSYSSINIRKIFEGDKEDKNLALYSQIMNNIESPAAGNFFLYCTKYVMEINHHKILIHFENKELIEQAKTSFYISPYLIDAINTTLNKIPLIVCRAEDGYEETLLLKDLVGNLSHDPYKDYEKAKENFDSKKPLIDEMDENVATFNYHRFKMICDDKLQETIYFMNAVIRLFISLNVCTDNAYYILGLCYKEKGDYKSAIEKINMAISISPKNMHYYSNLAICYKDLKLFDKALECYEKIIEINKGNSIPEYSALIYSEMAEIFLELGHIQKAEEYYKKAINIDSKFYSYFLSSFLEHNQAEKVINMVKSAKLSIEEKEKAFEELIYTIDYRYNGIDKNEFLNLAYLNAIKEYPNNNQFKSAYTNFSNELGLK